MNTKRNRKTLIIILCSIGVLLIGIGIYLVVTKPNYQEIVNNISNVDIPFLNSLVNNQEEEEKNNIGNVEEFTVSSPLLGQEDSFTRAIVSVKIPDDINANQELNPEGVMFTGEGFLLVVEKDNESFLRKIQILPEYTIIKSDTSSSSIYRIKEDGNNDYSQGILKTVYHSNYNYSYYYSETFILKNECKQYWSSSVSNYEACDQGVLQIRNNNGEIKGILRVFCAVDDPKNVVKCDEIVESLVVRPN